MQNAIYQLAIGFGLVVYAAASPCPCPIMAANAAEPVASNRLIDLIRALQFEADGYDSRGHAVFIAVGYR
jgi:hypothetical protein